MGACHEHDLMIAPAVERAQPSHRSPNAASHRASREPDRAAGTARRAPGSDLPEPRPARGEGSQGMRVSTPGDCAGAHASLGQRRAHGAPTARRYTSRRQILSGGVPAAHTPADRSLNIERAPASVAGPVTSPVGGPHRAGRARHHDGVPPSASRVTAEEPAGMAGWRPMVVSSSTYSGIDEVRAKGWQRAIRMRLPDRVRVSRRVEVAQPTSVTNETASRGSARCATATAPGTALARGRGSSHAEHDRERGDVRDRPPPHGLPTLRA